MTARSLLALFDSVYVLALTAWVGSASFLSFGLAPILFRKSGGESEGRLAKAILPRFYAWGMTWGAIALPSLMGVPLSRVRAQFYFVRSGTLVEPPDLPGRADLESVFAPR